MRKLIALAAIGTVIITAAYFSSCKGKKSEPQANNKEDSLQKVLKRGEYLAIHVTGCIDCHSKRDFTKYSGPVIPGTEGGGGFVFDKKLLEIVPGTIHSRNITPDRETGIGGWTDDEILRAMTKGISKNGDTLFPLMPYPHLNKMPKDDLLSIIAYIRTLKPIKNMVPARELMMPISMAYPGEELQNSIDSNISPPVTDRVNYGKYMVEISNCFFCHTGGAGGIMVFNIGLAKVAAANITPDSATGIGTWTEERFLTKFTQYREEKNYNFTVGKENTIMPVSQIAGMTDDDLKAIYAYLRTVKPVAKKVEKYPQ